jgi:hypothetical protein
MLSLNLGCGSKVLKGFVNVDQFPTYQPDLVFNLEETPWPWEDDSVIEVLFNQSLEHMGGEPRVFLNMMKELYRVCADGAVININVPHPRHDFFMHDPTHVRIVTPGTLNLFNKAENDQTLKSGAACTTLAHHLKIDFFLEDVKMIPDERYAKMIKAGELTADECIALAQERNNVFTDIYMVMRARKPYR